MSDTVSEAEGCKLLARLFRARGYAIKRNVSFNEYGVSFDIDGWDAAARVGFEFMSSEQEDHVDLSLAEFKSRVKAALRRGGLRDRGTIQTEIEAGDLAIDVERRKVRVRGKDATLTFIEFEILVALASEPGKVMSRKQLLEDIWGASGFRSPRTVDVHMRHLREKLEKNPKKPEYLFTVRGVGYRFRDEEAD